MKRQYILGIIAFLLCLSLAGCGNKKVTETESLIDSIGTVTLDSEEKISLAEEAYNELSAKDKSEVSNKDTLDEAREKLNALIKEHSLNLAREAYEVIDNNAVRLYVMACDIHDAWQTGSKADFKKRMMYSQFRSYFGQFSGDTIDRAASSLGMSAFFIDDFESFMRLFIKCSEYDTTLIDIQAELNGAKESIKGIDASLEAYNTLKEYYTDSDSFLTTVSSLSGSLASFTSEINSFGDKVQQYRSRLDFELS